MGHMDLDRDGRSENFSVGGRVSSPAVPSKGALALELESHRRILWSICYRMTGVAADADDLVQETFARALVARPDRSTEPLRPWLAQVALRLAIDDLRRRRRRAYLGPWLPGPASVEAADLQPSPEERYGTVESASFAFLVALEELTPLQRAVLLLRDVLGNSVRESAQLLSTTEGAVKLAHLRARRAMEGYERERQPLTPALEAKTSAALQAFLSALLAGDVPCAERLLADDVRAVTDSAGRYRASAHPLLGVSTVARFFTGITAQAGGKGRITWARLNGLPALVIEPWPPSPGIPPRLVLSAALDADGRIARLYVVSADRKVRTLTPTAADRPA